MKNSSVSAVRNRSSVFPFENGAKKFIHSKKATKIRKPELYHTSVFQTWPVITMHTKSKLRDLFISIVKILTVKVHGHHLKVFIFPTNFWTFPFFFLLGIAFPCCISVNNCICHYSPLNSEADTVMQVKYFEKSVICSVFIETYDFWISDKRRLGFFHLKFLTTFLKTHENVAHQTHFTCFW